MRQIQQSIALALALGLSVPALAGPTDGQQGAEKTQSTFKKGKSKSASASAETGGNSLFQNRPKSWAVGAHIGLPRFQGDITSNGLSIGGGLFVQKAIGHTFSIRANTLYGIVTGINNQANDYISLQNNSALTGKVKGNSPNLNIRNRPGGAMYMNYRTTILRFTVDAVINMNNLNYLIENPRIGAYFFAGAGGLLYNPKYDQLDAKGQLYDYSDINKNLSASQRLSAVKKKLDGKFESLGDRDNNRVIFGNWLGAPAMNMGLGFTYKINNKLNAQIEGQYMFTGSDLLDGQRWYNQGVPSVQPDATLYFNLGATYRLGSEDRIYWFTNPLSLPYKTIEENKKKLAEVDKMRKELDTVKSQLAGMKSNVDSLTADNDKDGVSDYFDMEDGTPSGAIVNGAGQTIFYKNEKGDMVFVDPNADDDAASGNPANMPGGNKGNGSDNNGLNQGGNNNQNGGFYSGDEGNDPTKNGSNAGKGRKKKTFNPNQTNGRVTMLTNNGKGGYNAVASSSNNGTNTAIGFLPAVFFADNSAEINTKSYPELFEIARALKANPNVKLKVIGFTDHRNTEAYNKQLGERRARTVSNALVTYFGVDKNQLIVESKGEKLPLTNASTLPALAANRRVQFEVVDGNMNASDLKSGSNETQPAKAAPVKAKTAAKKPAAKAAPKAAAPAKVQEAPAEIKQAPAQEGTQENQEAPANEAPAKEETPQTPENNDF